MADLDEEDGEASDNEEKSSSLFGFSFGSVLSFLLCTVSESLNNLQSKLFVWLVYIAHRTQMNM